MGNDVADMLREWAQAHPESAANLSEAAWEDPEERVWALINNQQTGR